MKIELYGVDESTGTSTTGTISGTTAGGIGIGDSNGEEESSLIFGRSNAWIRSPAF